MRFNLSDINLFIILLVLGLVILTIVRRLLRYPPIYIFLGLIGLLLGLLLGDLLSGPLLNLPSPWGKWLPVFVTVIVAASVVDFFLAQVPSWIKFIDQISEFLPKREKETFEIVVDTSVLIDGRIEEIVKTGFILGKLVVPRFVVDELQKVSDSKDSLKRTRGRQGLEVLSRLIKNPDVEASIIDVDFRIKAVDKKLVKIAKERNARLLTCDYNLEKVAEISGVSVLNINELSEALKPIVLPGESIMVKVIGPGKEKSQGISYLPDGTMIVIENGNQFIGQEIECQVEKIYQTVTGKVIFGKPK